MTEERQPGTFEAHILTLFPEFFASPLAVSILGRAIERGLVRIEVHDIRHWAEGRHRVCDDTPYGGGAGMVMKPDPVVAAMEGVDSSCVSRGAPRPRRVALTPSGVPFSQGLAEELANEPMCLICGRYEGIDQRALDRCDMQISLGDFVMTGGEPAALAIIDTVIRLIPGVLGNAASAEDESFAAGLLEYPHFTRPAVFRGDPVPDVLTSGNHRRIDEWRRGQALLRTQRQRPDLFAEIELSARDHELLAEAEAEASNNESTNEPG